MLPKHAESKLVDLLGVVDMAVASTWKVEAGGSGDTVRPAWDLPDLSHTIFFSTSNHDKLA